MNCRFECISCPLSECKYAGNNAGYIKEYNRVYYREHKDEISDYNRQYYIKHREEILEKRKGLQNDSAFKARRKAYQRRYYLEHQEELITKSRERYRRQKHDKKKQQG